MPKPVEIRLVIPESLARRLQQKAEASEEDQHDLGVLLLRYIWDGLIRDLAKTKFSSRYATIPVGLEIQNG